MPMAIRAVTFASHDCDEFVAEIKAKVAEYFERTGLSQKANAAMKVKTVALFAAFFVPYGLILANAVPPLAMWGLTVLMGVALAGIGFGISHDALHGAYSDNPKLNAALGYSFDLMGASSYMWKITHNVVHHTYTNVHPIDEDLEVSPLLRLSPLAKHHRFHRWQHLYALAAYSMSTLNWVFWKDYDYFTRKDIGPYLNKKHPRADVATLVVSKVFYAFWAIALPLMLVRVPLWQFALGWFTMHLVGGTILGVVFQLAHVVEQTQHPVPDDLGRMPNGWMVHEMLTTANFCVGNPWITWYVAGLNHQIEHHLFPKTCSVHYPAISKIVKEVTLKHGLPYYENTTFLGAVGSHLRILRRLGRAESPNVLRHAVAA